MMRRTVIGMGSNVGDRAGYLAQAIMLMAERVGRVVQCTPVTETPAWGFEAPPFLNQSVLMHTWLTPIELLDELQAIERELGRSVKTRYEEGHAVYSDRTIDLDILDYDGIAYHDERLTLPHPQIPHRDFVRHELSELGIRIVEELPPGTFRLEYNDQ
ncbi:MAG: 2-amino-4-hydroxy-6-hydroxymethyldihydropteridine diphosphokinase [Bacteroidales bacterium]|nr:2-amino-4-hydroxy-6-hydroxymethyldihydropteridine diphosphokinase [Bacteroidales bacterium]